MRTNFLPRSAVVRTSLVFASVGAILVPMIFLFIQQVVGPMTINMRGMMPVLVWLEDIQMFFWPSSILFLADPLNEHPWTYLAATIIPNAILYSIVGALSFFGRQKKWVLVILILLLGFLVFAVHRWLGSHLTSLAAAMLVVSLVLYWHHRVPRDAKGS